MTSKKRPVSLADLRTAAPGGWTVDEFFEGTRPFWRVTARDESQPDIIEPWRIALRLANRQTARRAALAALRAMGKKP